MSVEVFYVENIRGRFVGDVVFLSEERARALASDMECYNGGEYRVDSISLPFVGRYISRAQVYYGFDYSFSYNGGGSSIYDSITISPFYPSVDEAKEFGAWKIAEAKANLDKENHNFYPLKICSKGDFPDQDFYYGDVMEGKFSAEIKRFRVDKRM